MFYEDQVRPDPRYAAALKVYSEAVRALQELRGAALFEGLERAHQAHLTLRPCLEERPAPANATAFLRLARWY
jgi:hypothetical protein